MKKITIKSSVLAFALTAGTGFGIPAGAGVFDQLAAVANSALPSYGRDYLQSYKPDLSKETIIAGIKEAVTVGCDRVVALLVEEGGYLSDGQSELSSDLRKAKKLAAKLSFDEQFHKFEMQLNEASIAVTPVTCDVLKTTLPNLTIAEPRSLLVSHDTAVTDYLFSRVQSALRRQLEPVAQAKLLESGATSLGTEIASKISLDGLFERLVLEHVVEQNIEDFFLHLQVQEQAIRQNPELRTTALLQDVFG